MGKEQRGENKEMSLKASKENQIFDRREDVTASDGTRGIGKDHS